MAAGCWPPECVARNLAARRGGSIERPRPKYLPFPRSPFRSDASHSAYTTVHLRKALFLVFRSVFTRLLCAPRLELNARPGKPSPVAPAVPPGSPSRTRISASNAKNVLSLGLVQLPQSHRSFRAYSEKMLLHENKAISLLSTSVYRTAALMTPPSQIMACYS